VGLSVLVLRSALPALVGLCAILSPGTPAASGPGAPVPVADSAAAAVATSERSSDDSDGSPLEVRVKAAFLYKFSGYVEWPPQAGATQDSSIVFGVMGDDGLADELARLVRRRGPDARPVRVLRLRAFEPRPRLHVLFIGHGESDHLGALIRREREQPILIVTDTDGAVALGSMINFVTTGGHVRFEVGLGAARSRGLTLSSRLIAVAQTVSSRTP